MRSYSYDAELGIASIEDELTGIKVLTLLQNPGYQQAARNAYLGAAYSRSNKSVSDLMTTVQRNNVDTNQRMERIYHEYGHASVAGMAHLSICIENVPEWFAFRFFNFFSLGDGQQRSTRYVRSDRYYVPINLEGEQKEQYQTNIQQLFGHYNSLYDSIYSALAEHFKVEHKQVLASRTLDCVRFFLPLATLTNLYMNSSARTWSQFITECLSEGDEVELTVASLLLELLVGCDELESQGYVAEAPGLIRHTEPKPHLTEARKKMRDTTSRLLDTTRTFDGETRLRLVNPYTFYLENLLLLSDVSAEVEDISPSEYLLNTVRTELEKYTHYDQLPVELGDATYYFDGVTDAGSLRDLNRHRSLWRFIPALVNPALLHANDGYALPAYLDHVLGPLGKLRNKYVDALNKYYESIAPLWNRAEFKYLIPMAHRMRYRIGGSMDKLLYTVQLRTRPGGHINYRLLTREWAQLLRQYSPLLPLNLVAPVDIDNREEFLDRS